MSELCSQADLFADGELSAEDAARFEKHLATCARCERRLGNVLLLSGLAQDHGVPEEKGNVIALAPRRRRAVLAAATSALAAAAAVLFVVRAPGRDADPFAIGATRPLEVRLTHAGAREFRPHGVARAGEPESTAVPLAKLAELEKAGDLDGVATAYLLHGDLEQASAFLARAGSTPAVDSDRAALALSRGRVEEALRLCEGVLAQGGAHPEARWNRALALSALGLELAAAEEFSAVAALAEPGWSGEAAQRAAALRRSIDERKRAYLADWDAGSKMIAGGPAISGKSARFRPGLSRLVFYDAVRAAPSAERVDALLPLAVQLDERAGTTVLAGYLRRVAAGDFSKRAPLAAAYRALVAKSDAAGWAALVARLMSAGQDDLLLGALVNAKAVQAHLALFQRLAAAQNDPWFTAIERQEAARALVGSGELLAAEKLLLQAVRDCRAARVEYRCVFLESDLSDLYATLYRTVEGFAHAQAGLALAHSLGEWFQEAQLLQPLAQMARFRSAPALARAYLHEAQLRSPDLCAVQNYTHESLAALAVSELDAGLARRELDARVTCAARPLSLEGAMVLADLSRLSPRAGDEVALRQALAALRAGGLAAGGLALADQIEGRLVIERDRAAGTALLRRAIAAADALPPSAEDARKARAYAFSALVQDAGKAGEYGVALALLAEEARAPLPARCAVGLAVDDARSLIAVRGADGEARGTYDGKRTAPPNDFAPALSAPLAKALAACATVVVLARPPLHGRAGVLPPEMAWSYFVGKERPAAAVRPPPRRLVVAGVQPPPSLGLPALSAWALGPAAGERKELRGADATPERVLAELPSATEIELHVHGLVDLGLADSSLLVLTADADGDYALTARRVRAAKLAGAPVVLLAACHAAQESAALHAPWSLPVAFLEAGARAVLASPAEIPDEQAAPFFDAVLGRIRAGQEPAAALRDERLAFRTRPGGAWVDRVLVFE